MKFGPHDTSLLVKPQSSSGQSKENMVGLVLQIMRFCLHDGPGIRTTVFLKGCPLRCWWCHNPESHSFQPEIAMYSERCIRCGKCLEVCSEQAISLAGDLYVLEASKCNLCGACTQFCPAEALQIIGRSMSVADVMQEVRKDLIFYDQSGGGVTFSGGEPFMQPAFLLALLKACQEEQISTAVDTCGYVALDILAEISSLVDLFLFDLKLIDSKRHQYYTGVPNELILSNLKYLAALKREVVVRIPIIPGVNDDPENIRQSGEFVKSLGLKKVHLLPYHKGGTGKYERLHREYRLKAITPPSSDKIDSVTYLFKKMGLEVKIGG